MNNILEQKQKIVNEIATLISNSISLTLVDYSKITSLEIKKLRKSLIEKNIKIKVFKNNLTKKALLNNKDILIPYVNGQIFIIFNNTENNESLKMINDLGLKNNTFKIKTIYLYGKIFINEDIKKIINLKNKESELEKLILCLKMPIIKLLYILKKLIEIKKGESNDIK